MIFLASGTGFTPIKALLEQLREQGDNTRRVHLYWGGRRRKDLYEHEELLALHAGLPWSKYIDVLPWSGEACDWQGSIGYVHLQVLADGASLENFEVYAYGAPVMVDSARRDFVAQRQLADEDFFADAFV